MKRLKEKIGGERAKWYVIWSKWIPRIVLPSSHLQHQSHSSLSVTRLHCICICVCICIFQSLSLAVQGVSWTNGVLSTLWFYWLPIIIHYNSPESVSAIKQICEAGHITIQILSRIALEHTISNTNNIRVFFFLATKCLRKGFIVSDWRSPKSLSQTHYAIFYQCHCQFVNFIVCLFVRSAKNTSATFSISLEDIYVVEQASDKT